MKREIKKASIPTSKKYFRIMLMLLAAFLIYGSIVTYVVYKNILQDNYDNISGMLETNTESINKTLDMINGTAIAISGSQAISNWRNDSSYFSGTAKNKRLHIEELNNELQRILIYNGAWNFNLYDYVAVYENDELLAYTYTKTYSIKRVLKSTEEIYKRIADDESYSLILAPSNDDKTIYTTLRVKSDFTSDNSIYVIGATSVKAFNETLKSMAALDGVKVYLTDKNGTVYASNIDDALGQTLSEDLLKAKSKAVVSEGHVNYEVIKSSVNNSFSIVYMFPKQSIMRQTLVGMESLIIMSAVIAIIMVLVLTAMESSYERRLLEEEAEIKFLQQQMNPHFLFNILLTIQIKAKMSKDESVYRMISSLSSLLRAGIYGDKRALISVEEELKYVDYYLSLQKERFDDRLTYTINVEDEALKKCQVPRLSIEPIVENAIVHGVENVEDQAKVSVNVTSQGNELVIHVIDNGSGFDASTLNLDEVTKTEDGLTREKVGLKSTAARIKLIYGKKYGLEINSQPGQGTDIAIRIPRKKWELGND